MALESDLKFPAGRARDVFNVQRVSELRRGRGIGRSGFCRLLIGNLEYDSGAWGCGGKVKSSAQGIQRP